MGWAVGARQRAQMLKCLDNLWIESAIGTFALRLGESIGWRRPKDDSGGPPTTSQRGEADAVSTRRVSTFRGRRL